jgi:hypothetical protein
LKDKIPYKKPKLKVHGKMNKITKGSFSGGGEGPGKQQFNGPPGGH